MVAPALTTTNSGVPLTTFPHPKIRGGDSLGGENAETAMTCTATGVQKSPTTTWGKKTA